MWLSAGTRIMICEYGVLGGRSMLSRLRGEHKSGSPVRLEQSLQAASTRLATGSHPEQIHRQFIIGGASMYSGTLALNNSEMGYVDRVMLTRILSPSFDECDVFMPDF